MRRLPALLLVLTVAALGSGALRYVHELEHEARGTHHHDEPDAPDAPAHEDDSGNCFVHAKLNLPMLGGAWVSAPIYVGTFVAFVTSPTVRILCRRPVLKLDSRGPPVG